MLSLVAALMLSLSVFVTYDSKVMYLASITLFHSYELQVKSKHPPQTRAFLE